MRTASAWKMIACWSLGCGVLGVWAAAPPSGSDTQPPFLERVIRVGKGGASISTLLHQMTAQAGLNVVADLSPSDLQKIITLNEKPSVRSLLGLIAEATQTEWRITNDFVTLKKKEQPSPAYLSRFEVQTIEEFRAAAAEGIPKLIDSLGPQHGASLLQGELIDIADLPAVERERILKLYAQISGQEQWAQEAMKGRGGRYALHLRFDPVLEVSGTGEPQWTESLDLLTWIERAHFVVGMSQGRESQSYRLVPLLHFLEQHKGGR
ncbi:MAG: hypothetical protein NZT92_19915 [Abditibacteriales bacterium]|nr:hypothetical protein [Abditibacteriales bacterium]